MKTMPFVLLMLTALVGLTGPAAFAVEADFAARFGRTLSDVYTDVLPELHELGLIETKAGAIKLTDRGRLLGNEVFSRFFDPQ
mgnify:CR=1 FL=1